MHRADDRPQRYRISEPLCPVTGLHDPLFSAAAHHRCGRPRRAQLGRALRVCSHREHLAARRFFPHNGRTLTDDDLLNELVPLRREMACRYQRPANKELLIRFDRGSKAIE